MENLTNVHDAVKDAQLNKEPKSAMETFTYRAVREDKEAAETICKAHGISVSSYLRSCLKGLVKDYSDIKI